MHEEKTKRPPVVAIMGHVDHGKSTLLDFIRKSNVVDGEAGGITQHLSAYEVDHKDADGNHHFITFIDTPGHAAFSGMRDRGAQAADIAILIVSAEDSIKTQTIEALETIRKNNVPFIIAINKIDKQGANIEKVKYDLMEHQVYVEGLGGTTPVVAISAKNGTGIPDLLETITLVAEMEEFKGHQTAPAEGIVIESHMDPKTGAQATLIVKDGCIAKGQFVVAGSAIAPTRMLESGRGSSVDHVICGSPVRISGWSSVPVIGSSFTVFTNKKEAEEFAKLWEQANPTKETLKEGVTYIPLIIRTDVTGTCEAILKEVQKMAQETIAYNVISKGVGNISENDMKIAGTDKNTVIVGFGVKVDNTAREIGEQLHIDINLFNIIYKLTEFLEENLENKRPRVQTLEALGALKVLRTFSQTKDKQVLGGKVILGKIEVGSIVRVLRRDNEIGQGKITEVQKSKVKTKEAILDEECGLMVESKVEIAPQDVLEAFIMVAK